MSSAVQKQLHKRFNSSKMGDGILQLSFDGNSVFGNGLQGITHHFSDPATTTRNPPLFQQMGVDADPVPDVCTLTGQV